MFIYTAGLQQNQVVAASELCLLTHHYSQLSQKQLGFGAKSFSQMHVSENICSLVGICKLDTLGYILG